MDKLGGAKVDLFIEITVLGKKITEVRFKPFEWGWEIQWREGRIPSSLALLSTMTGMPQATLRRLTKVDYERVSAMMSVMVPDVIREAMASGQWPEQAEGGEADEAGAAAEGAAAGAGGPYPAQMTPEEQAAHNEAFRLDDDISQPPGG